MPTNCLKKQNYTSTPNGWLSFPKAILLLMGGGFLLALILWVLLIVAYMLPIGPMQPNALASAEIIAEEGTYPQVSGGPGTLDNFTTALMLDEAVLKPTLGPAQAALSCDYAIVEADMVEGLYYAAGGEVTSDEVHRVSYARYWHGYLILIKPLLLLFNVVGIRTLLGILFLLSFVGACVCMIRALGFVGVALAVCLGLSITFVGGWQAACALPTSFSLIISLLALTYACKASLSYPYRFLLTFGLIGALTVYFDFLDTPLLTLAMPLVVLLVRMIVSNDARFDSWRTVMKYLFCCAFGWAFGWVFLWALKWSIASVVLGANIFGDAQTAAVYRMSSGESEVGRISAAIEAIRINISDLGLGCIILALIVISTLALCIAATLKGRTSKSKFDLSRAIPLLIALFVVSLLPYAWYAVLAEHSFRHHEFIAFRGQMVVFFCWFAGLVIAAHSLLSPTAKSCGKHGYTKRPFVS